MRHIAAMILAAAVVLTAASCGRGRADREAVVRSGGDPDRGRAAILKYGCTSCHSIPGVRQADSWVGPPLDSYARRSYVAGTLPNTPENLMLFILDPAAVRPGTAMPDVGLTTEEARDITAYLYTLR